MAIATVHVPPGSYSGGELPNYYLDFPTVTSSLTYNGDAQEPTFDNYDPLQLQISGTTSATDAGTYTVTFTPIGQCVWAKNGSQNPYSVEWTIGKATPNFSASIDAPVVYGETGTITIDNPNNYPINATTSDSSVLSIESSSSSAVVVRCNKYSASAVNVTLTVYGTDNYNGKVIICRVPTEKADGGELVFSDFPSSYISGERVLSINTFDSKTFTVSENPTGGTLSVSVSNSTCLSSSISGNVVTVNALQYSNAYLYVTVTAAATDNYKAVSKQLRINLYKATGVITLSEDSGTITYGESKTITLTASFGEISSVSTGLSGNLYKYLSTSRDGNQVTITCNGYTSETGTVSFTVYPVDTNYANANATYNVSLARATPTLELSKTSCSLDADNPSADITVTTNSTGAISATPADNSVCTASVNENVVTIFAQTIGNTTVDIAVAQSTNYLAASKAVAVAVAGVQPKNILEGRTLADVKQIFQSGQGAQYFRPGDYFDLTMADTVTLDSNNTIDAGSTWRAVLIGINHNAGIEGSDCGHFCICKNTDDIPIAFYPKQMNSTMTAAGGWAACEMKTWLNDTFYNALPADLKAVIVDTVKYTDNVVDKSNAESCVTATTQKIWLLAMAEYSANSYQYNPYEKNKQAQYAYFKSTTLGNFVRHADEEQTTCMAWSRTPPNYLTTAFCVYGARLYDNHATFSYGFQPCFCIG